VDTELAELIRPIREQLPRLETVVNIVDGDYGEALDGPDYETFLATGTHVLLDKPVEDENETISINYTSGTTGNPKGVMYTHRSAYLNALDEMLEMGVNSRSTYLWTLPMFHCNGWCFTWGVTAVGATHVCLHESTQSRCFGSSRPRTCRICAEPHRAHCADQPSTGENRSLSAQTARHHRWCTAVTLP
jgi:fatty-acyl-CoA synthase